MNYRALLVSPQKADPLTWIMVVNMPIIAMILAAVGSLGVIEVTMGQGVLPWAMILRTCLVVTACALIAHNARPQRPDFTVKQGFLPFALAVVSVVVSAYAHLDSNVPIELWSGPFGIGLVILALTPYTSALMLLAYGIVGGAVSGIVGLLAFEQAGPGIVAHVLAGAAIPLHTGVIGATFCALAVAGVMRWRALPYDDAENGTAADFTQHVREFGTPLSVSDDVVSLLRRVADDGRVTTKERRRATELATGIRADLVGVLNRSWLDTIAQQNSLTVVDEGRFAEKMTTTQRAALHALIMAVLGSPMLTEESLRIELRQQEDGTIAVGLGMNISMPEGQRVMMLAPYVVSLRSTVDNLEWAGGEELRMRFHLPPPEEMSRR